MQTGEITVLVIIGLFLFGVLYDLFVGWLEREGHDEGYTAVLVIVGVLATLGGAQFLIGPEATLAVLACFAASGGPMTVGSMWRYTQRRKKERQQFRDEVRRDL